MKLYLNQHFTYSTNAGKNPATENKLIYQVTTIILTIWLVAGLLIYLPDNGGSGLALPFNIISWCVMALVSLWLAFRLPTFVLEPVVSMPTMRLLPLGALLWSLPLCWSPSKSAMLESLPHVMALWGLLCFLWLLRRLPLSKIQRRGFLLIVAAAAFLQAAFGFVQVAYLNHVLQATSHSAGYTRLLGIFQQPNVLASFVATGIVSLVISQHKGALANFALLFMAFVLVLIQSRAGWIGTTFGMLFIVISSLQRDGQTRQLFTPFFFVATGVFIAYTWQHGWLNPLLTTLFPGVNFSKLSNAFVLVNKTGSTLERWAIIKTTWQMILHHPFLGTGYGGFEPAFTHQAQQSGGPFVSAILTHPHNEILYAWSEGGLPALVGLLLMVSDIIWMLWRRGGWRWEGLALLTPLICHINLEYPLYLSVPHALTLVILLNTSLAPSSFTALKNRELPLLIKNITANHIRWGIIAISLSVLFFMIGALQTQQQLTAVERGGLITLLPESGESVESTLWNKSSQYQRLDYDKHIALLVHYNMTHDINDLKDFDRWATNYLSRHNDANVYLSELKIYSAIHPRLYKLICLKAHNIWPRSINFNCDGK
ncbi:O-antigen ligase family protein [uncultured Pluralibacter sp.]|uniref:O-antigen ligase family protein n=1 Tax=uncultured Pluralibacter sp. TaxID=1490864 RepID=UPI00261DDD48|nr:O-antigen ligase family protein [uncultured Pluralibacter sp.]